MNDLVDTHKDIADLLRAQPGVQAAWVFGSFAGGPVRPGSDLDVAVLGKEPLDAAQKKTLIERLARTVGRPVDLIDLQATRGPIVGQVLRHGRRLFCDDTTRYAELLKRWMFDQADWMPYRRRILRTRRQAWIDR